MKAYTTACPEKGKANKTVIKLLAEFFQKKPSDISLIQGERSREKIIRVDCYDGEAKK